MAARVRISARSRTMLPDVFAQISRPSRIGTPLEIMVPRVRVNRATATFRNSEPKTGAFKKKGIDTVACVAVNDPFVLGTWGNVSGGKGKVLFLSDGNGEFTEKIGMDFDGSGIGLGTRSKRYAMLVDDGVVKVLHTEDSPGVADVSTAESMLAEI